MFSKLVSILVGLFVLLTAVSSVHAADPNWKTSLPNNLGFLIYKVSMAAKPSVVSVELYSASRGIERLEGTGYVLTSSGTGIEIMLTAPVDLIGSVGDEQVSFAFSAAKPTGEIVRFPIQTTTFAAIKAAAIPLSAIDEQIKIANQELKREDRLAKSEDDRLTALKGQTLQMTGVDDLVELNTELDSLTDVPVLTDAELTRLNQLYHQGISGVADQAISDTVSDLNQQLFLVTKLTTKTDQAERARFSQRHTDIGRRIAMIKESLSLNSEEIAREIVRLRAHRRELEQQMTGPVAAPPSSSTPPEEEF